MSSKYIIDLSEQFFEYSEQSQILMYNSSQNETSNFINMINSILMDFHSLEEKMHSLKQSMSNLSRFTKDKQTKMLMHIKENLKILQRSIKRLEVVEVDIKGNHQFKEGFKGSIQASLKTKSEILSKQLKGIIEKKNTQESRGKTSHVTKNKIQLNKSHFLEQNQHQLAEELAQEQYKELQKDLYEISDKYQTIMTTVLQHESLIDSIQQNIIDTEGNMSGGKRHLGQVQKRQLKNRAFIIKVFTLLYVIVFIYIVFLS